MGIMQWMMGLLEVEGRTAMYMRRMKVIGKLTIKMRRCDGIDGIQLLHAALSSACSF
jgi:hypothetical protein